MIFLNELCKKSELTEYGVEILVNSFTASLTMLLFVVARILDDFFQRIGQAITADRVQCKNVSYLFYRVIDNDAIVGMQLLQ